MGGCDRDVGSSKPNPGKSVAPPREPSALLDGRALPIQTVLAFQEERDVQLILSTKDLECGPAWDQSTRESGEVRIWLSFSRGPRGGEHKLVTGGFAADGEGLTKRRRAVLEGAVVDRMTVRTAPGERTEVVLRARLTQLQSDDATLGNQTLSLSGTFEARGCGERTDGG